MKAGYVVSKCLTKGDQFLIIQSRYLNNIASKNRMVTTIRCDGCVAG